MVSITVPHAEAGALVGCFSFIFHTTSWAVPATQSGIITSGLAVNRKSLSRPSLAGILPRPRAGTPERRDFPVSEQQITATRARRPWTRRHLLGLEELSAEEIVAILD